jgi:hypothetical protein
LGLPPNTRVETAPGHYLGRSPVEWDPCTFAIGTEILTLVEILVCMVRKPYPYRRSEMKGQHTYRCDSRGYV